MESIFEKKIKSFKTRLLKKKYEYNQINSAGGIWFKLRIYLTISNKIVSLKNKNEDLYKFNYLGELSSLLNTKKFYYIEEKLFNLPKENCVEISNDLNEILRNDYEIIIFLL